EILLFYNSELKDFLPQFQYSKLKMIQWEFPPVVKGYLQSWIKQKNIFSNELVMQYELDGVYPEWNQPIFFKHAYDKSVRSVSWFADLQHKYYPEFFSKWQWIMRESRLRLMLRNTEDLVVSSKAAEEDFKRFYNLRKDLKIHVLNFVSLVDDFSIENPEMIRKKYGLPEKYFIVSNQFHKHKNHSVVLKAIALLKVQKRPIHVAITGKMPDSNSSPYIRELHDIVENNSLEEQVTMLGVIPRNDQLNLMKISQAVIQPSLFEGWSTVIEDAKSLQVPVIASDLKVNTEQLGDKGTYFKASDAHHLADIISGFDMEKDELLYEKYDTRVRDFSEKFLNIFN
ncbi:glycosyltransferase family 4 protein, partial [Pleurocapsales cyanobacterium LEGE 10410]|nr:glycosyltransferase family 4 protein [Pleurocapsales cyanobacterium LEGE 10410]